MKIISRNDTKRGQAPFQKCRMLRCDHFFTFLLDNLNLYVRGKLFGAVDFMNRLLKIFDLGMKNVHKLLGIAVDHRKPGALYLHHDPVTFSEAVALVSKVKRNLGHLVRNYWLRMFKAVPVFTPEDFTGKKHLKMPHPHILGIGLVIRSIAGININQAPSRFATS